MPDINVLTILYYIIIKPILFILEILFGNISILFSTTNTNLVCTGFSLILLSVIVNVLLLPFYNYADKIQAALNQKEKEMHPYVSHIKRVFKGSERTMILQTYYNENHFSPLLTLKGSFSLLIQIPLFIAAYQLIAELLPLFQGVSFLFIKDLSLPDGLISFPDITINVLPIFMTAINLISCFVYGKEKPFKNRLQTYIISVVFLILLYNSPSCFVLYWTTNNVFSLVKNIIQRHKKKKDSSKKELKLPKIKFRYFFVVTISLSVITGLYIPSQMIHSSVNDFIMVKTPYSPTNYIICSALIAFGMFVFWCNLLYCISNNTVKMYFFIFLSLFLIDGIINYLFFGYKYKNLTDTLEIRVNNRSIGLPEILNLIILILVLVFILLMLYKKISVLYAISFVIIFSFISLSFYNIVGINKDYHTLTSKKDDNDDKIIHYQLSKTGKNVIVLILDTATASYIPHLIKEKPFIEEKLDGFTWYPNTLTYGRATNSGIPGIYGGYEYIPDAMNERADEYLGDKYREAIKLLPSILNDEDYSVTVINPEYSAYEVSGMDLSIYDDYKNVQAFNSGFTPTVNANEDFELHQITWCRDLFSHALMRLNISVLHDAFTNFRYFNYNVLGRLQHVVNKSTAYGTPYGFLRSYKILEQMPERAEITDEGNTCLIMHNSTVHDRQLLQEPEYIPSDAVDNTKYDEENQDRFITEYSTLNMEDEYDMMTYQSNMAAILKLCDWFDFMRENGVYDNTRIIIVADHASQEFERDDMICDFGEKNQLEDELFDIMKINPLLLVKDFDSHDFHVSNEFMTNADTPILALDGIVDEPVNPFTGKTLTDKQKYASEHHVYVADKWNPSENCGKTYCEGDWYKLEGNNVLDCSKWSYIGRK